MWSESPGILQIAILGFLGGVLGILAMVPLRRLLIIKADAELPYPEGRACAEVLKAAEKDSSDGKWVFIGIATGALIKLAASAMHWLPEELSWSIPNLPNATLALKVSPALLAVGYIIGYRAASVMVAGGLLATLVLYPLTSAVFADGNAVQLTAKAVKDRYITYIGAGAVAAAGMITVVRTAPTMLKSLLAVIDGMRSRGDQATVRTDRDMPAGVLGGGILALALVMMFVPGIFSGDLDTKTRILAGLGVVIFGFVFVPVSSRLVGLIGVSSNPTSAMALITIAGTAVAFKLWDIAPGTTKVAVLTVGTVVCVAASKAGDISQDLKTGFLIGATPARQQFGQLLAAAVSCWAVAAVVWAIGNGPEGFGEHGMPAPQARLMKTVVEAVIGESLPWTQVSAGAGITLVGFLAGLPALPFALGIYLPLATMAAVWLGGSLRRLTDGATPDKARTSRGVLCASGFVAGEGLAGVLIAGWALYSAQGRYTPSKPSTIEVLAAVFALVICGAAVWRASSGPRVSKP